MSHSIDPSTHDPEEEGATPDNTPESQSSEPTADADREPEQAAEEETAAADVEAERFEHGEVEEEAPTVDVGAGSPHESADAQTWALVAHLGPLALLLFGVSMPFAFLVPLIVLHTAGKDDAVITHHAKEALNFQLNVAILSVVFTITCVLIPLLIPLWLGDLVLCVIASIEVTKGKDYRYPLIYRVVD